MLRLISHATVALTLFVARPATGLTQGASRTVVLMHANVVDGLRGAFATNATVVIRDGKIADVVTGPFAPPADAQVIDVGGRYVLPGLIDCHTHIASLANAKRALESGVTTVRSASTPAFQDVALRELSTASTTSRRGARSAPVCLTPTHASRRTAKSSCASSSMRRQKPDCR